MVRGLFAAGFKKLREYVKHIIDLCAPLWLETTDKEYTIQKLLHVVSCTAQMEEKTHGVKGRRVRRITIKITHWIPRSSLREFVFFAKHEHVGK